MISCSDPLIAGFIAWMGQVGYALSYGVLAAIGGFIGYVFRLSETRTAYHGRKAVFRAAAAAFVGIIVLFLCDSYLISKNLKSALIGLSGWLGAPLTIRILEKLLLKRLGLVRRADRILFDDENQH